MPLKMTLDDKEFTLSNEALVAMATTLWRTRVKERGLMLCEDTEVTPGPEHIGGPWSIGVRNCRGKPRIGHYHTHPSPAGTSAPSWYDAYSIIDQSLIHPSLPPWLGCRGGKDDETIRCDTVKKVPSIAELALLKAERPKMKYTPAEADPKIWKYFAEPYSFPVRKVPEIIKPPVPVVAPRIKTEEVRFAESLFMRYTDLDTGEITIKRLY